jgi:hypothetical protein
MSMVLHAQGRKAILYSCLEKQYMAVLHAECDRSLAAPPLTTPVMMQKMVMTAIAI